MASPRKDSQGWRHAGHHLVYSSLLALVAFCNAPARGGTAVYQLEASDPIRTATRAIGYFMLPPKRPRKHAAGVWTSGRCPAAIISEQHIITTAFCARWGASGQVELRLGTDGWRPNGVTDAPKQNFFQLKLFSPLQVSDRLNFGILEVVGNPSKLFGLVKLLDRDPRQDEELFYIGPYWSVSTNCKVVDPSSEFPGQFKFNCSNPPVTPCPTQDEAFIFATDGFGILGVDNYREDYPGCRAKPGDSRASSIHAFLAAYPTIAETAAPNSGDSSRRQSDGELPRPSEQPKFIFSDFYIETVSKPKGWAERVGETIRNPQNSRVAGDIAEKYGLPREFTEATWQGYGAIANLIGPSDVSNNGEEENGFFRSPPGYTFCNAELLDEPDIHQTKDHLVTYLGIARRARNPDGLTYNDGLAYKIIVLRIADDSTWVKSHVRFVYIQADRQFVIRLAEEGKCVAHNTCVWLYENGDARKTDVFNCNPKDDRRDRWAATAVGETMSLEQLMRAIEAKGFEVTVKPK